MHGFSDINVEAPACGIDGSAQAAKSYLRSTVCQMRQLHERGTGRWALYPQEFRIERELLGEPRSAPSNCLASNLTLRLYVGCHGIDLFDNMQRRHPDRRFFLVTLISDRWLAYDRDTFIFLGGAKAAARPVMAMSGFDGWLGIVEVQTLVESVRDLGRLELVHVHAVGWSDSSDFDPEEAERRMAASSRLVSRVGVRTVDISYRADTSACNLIAYLLKAACVGKHRVPDRRSPSGLRLEDCALPPVSAVRQTEVLSGMYLDELLFAGGQGSLVCAELKRYIRGSVPPWQRQELSTENAQRFWDRARCRTGNDVFYWPVAIDRTGAQLPSESPLSLAAARFNTDRVPDSHGG